MKEPLTNELSLAGAHAQDAFGYFLAAGGKALEVHYGGEGVFVHSSNARLTERLANLDRGRSKVIDLMLACWHRLPRAARTLRTPGFLDGIDEIETVEQIETMARRGARFVWSLCQRFGIDPRTGLRSERVATWLDAGENNGDDTHAVYYDNASGGLLVSDKAGRRFAALLVIARNRLTGRVVGRLQLSRAGRVVGKQRELTFVTVEGAARALEGIAWRMARAAVAKRQAVRA